MTKKYILIFCCMALTLCPLMACNKSTPNPDQNTIQPQVAEDTAKPEDSAKPEDAAKPEDSAKPEEAPKPIIPSQYENMPSTDIPYPMLNDAPVLPSASNVNEKKTQTIYTYTNGDFIENYKKQLVNAGFEQKCDNIFIKYDGAQPLIVKMESGEGEYVISMLTTTDPEGRYQNLPHPNIPYPLDNGCLSAEFADYQAPNEASRETVYIYYNKPQTFADDYIKRLEESAFVNVRTPESPLHTKALEQTRELSVTVEKMNDAGTDVRIKMMLIQLENTP